MVLFDSSNARLTFDPFTRLVRLEFFTFIKGDEFRRAHRAGHEAVTKKGAVGWVSLTEKLGASDPEDEAWLMTELMPEAARSGLRSVALVVGTRAVSKLAMSSLSKRLGEFETRVVGTEAEALTWLRERQKAHAA